MNPAAIEEIVRATVAQLTKSKPEKAASKKEQWENDAMNWMERTRAKMIQKQLNHK